SRLRFVPPGNAAGPSPTTATSTGAPAGPPHKFWGGAAVSPATLPGISSEICVADEWNTSTAVPSTVACAFDTQPGNVPNAVTIVFGATGPLAKLAPFTTLVTAIAGGAGVIVSVTVIVYGLLPAPPVNTMFFWYTPAA